MAGVKAGGPAVDEEGPGIRGRGSESPVGTGSLTGSEVAPAGSSQVIESLLWWVLPALKFAHNGWARGSRQWERMKVCEADQEGWWEGAGRSRRAREGRWVEGRAAEWPGLHTTLGGPPSARDT